jgi:hypothetical protein
MVAALSLTSLAVDARTASARAAPQAPAVPSDPGAATVDPQRRDRLLGAGWRRSADRLWTTSGDATGLHVLVADARAGYTWRTVATLTVPGIETDRWVGNACVTGSGRRAVVVFAPRGFTNEPQLNTRGGFTAVVDLDTGAVRPVPMRSSLAYYNPGCGTGETAALTQEGDDKLGKTGLLRLDAATGKLGKRVEVAGQLTSAVPVGDGFAAAATSSVVRVAMDGKISPVAASSGVPFGLTPDAEGNVVFLDLAGDTSRVRSAAAVSNGRLTKAATLATGPAGQVGVRSGAGGRVYITGEAKPAAALPATVTTLKVSADAQLSTRAEAAVTSVAGEAQYDRSAPSRVRITASSLRTSSQIAFTVEPSATVAPMFGETVDAGRTCAVPRNDPRVQVYQPKPKQVEWAADMAVTGNLFVTRMPNWHGNGLSNDNPQVMFPPRTLRAGGRVPAQVMLGILGQESNLWQASRHALPGEYGNPLIGNYYGLEIYNDTEADDWDINFAEADCGYGVSQMTDGMRLAGHELPNQPAKPHDQQVAIATDYAANVAAGVQLLQDKWNQVYDAGMLLNNANPARIENWFYAIWSYNSGFHPRGEPGSNGAWGLGWYNNPANPRYRADRHNFGSDPHDYARPQDWPYPEKVLGFASDPPSGFEDPSVEVPFFRAAWWNGTEGDENTPGTAEYHKKRAFPPKNAFCLTTSNCHWGTSVVPNAPEVVGEPAGPCQHKNAAGQYDLKCWVNERVSWKGDCEYTCGREFMRYDYPEYAAEPADGTSYPPDCSTANDTNVLHRGFGIIGDVSDDTKPIRNPNCSDMPANAGTFNFTFAKDAAGREPGRIDLHQTGGGLGAHYWFSHARADTPEGQKLKVTGTWAFDKVVDGFAEVLVHIPHHGRSPVKRVIYTVETSKGPVNVYVDQNASTNHWQSLGKFPFYGQPKVHLSTITPQGGDGTERVFFDSLVFQPVYEEYEGKYRTIFHSDTENCLALRGNTAPNGSAFVEQRLCNGWNFNSWELVTMDANRGHMLLIDRGTGTCLAVAGNSTASGAAVMANPCDGSNPSQLWRVDKVYDPNWEEGDRPWNLVVNVRSALCLRPREASSGPPTTQQASCEVGPVDESGEQPLLDPAEAWELSAVFG